ncbi:MAG: hypothetical protein LBI53_00910 [Candidatus Peribacteria bacterium]|jgi:hypothetical protein|nr:hypothetical protein [Candidatus Peribacteria bacterium]
MSFPGVKIPSLHVKICSRSSVPPVIGTIFCSVVIDPQFVADTSYPLITVVLQFRLHIPPVHVAFDAQEEVGEIQTVVFPTLSLMIILHPVPIEVDVQLPHATAIQLSSSVLPVKVNCNIQLKIPSLGVQVPHTGAVVSIPVKL